MGSRPPGVEPRRRSAARRGGTARVGRRRDRGRGVRPPARPAGRAAGHRPQRGCARGRARGHDPAEDAAHARRHDRPGGTDRASRGRRDLARGRGGRRRARSRGARRLLARCRRRRLHARRRPLVARPQARHRCQPGDRGRARDGGRPAGTRRSRHRARPVLGGPWWRRRLRGRHGDRVQPVPDHGGLRGHPLVPGRASGRGSERLALLDGRPAGRAHVRRPDPPVPADPRDPGARPRAVVRRRRGDLRR